jgi:hypothetical protein
MTNKPTPGFPAPNEEDCTYCGFRHNLHLGWIGRTKLLFRLIAMNPPWLWRASISGWRRWLKRQNELDAACEVLQSNNLK